MIIPRVVFAALVVVVGSIADFSGFAATLHVRQDSPTPTPPYTSWETAAHTIQDAIDAAGPGDMVLVQDGVYSTGGRAVVGTMTNRVAIDKPITVQSVNGPAAAIIFGAPAPSGNVGEGAIRCAYVTNNAVISGFTLTGGHTRSDGEGPTDQGGGGIWCQPNGIVTNCVIGGNRAAGAGGGVFGGIVYNSDLNNNFATYGGGTAFSTAFNSVVHGNDASSAGGGSYEGALHETSVRWNRSYSFGGGTWRSQLESCVVEFNLAGVDGGGVAGGSAKNCQIHFNSARQGGGASGVKMQNCVLTRNAAYTGGGALWSLMTHCTVARNTAQQGGGIYQTSVTNSVVYHNLAVYGENWLGEDRFIRTCTWPMPLFLDYDRNHGNFTNEPGFLDLAGGSYHLRYGSPCIDAGTASLSVPVANDVAGNLRPLDGDWDGVAKFDMGAYEYNPLTMDSDFDGVSDWQERIADTNPTNAASCFRITAIAAWPAIALHFESSSNRHYTLFQATNLTDNSEESIWWPVAGQTDIPGSGGSVALADTNAASHRFYRVGVTLP